MNRQVQVSCIRRGGFAGIDHNHLHVAVLFVVLAQAIENDRVTFGGIGTNQKGAVGFFEVVVATGRSVRPETLDVSRHGRRHTQPGIGIEIIGSQTAFEQLLGSVVIFCLKLPGPVHANRFGTVHEPRGLDAIDNAIERLVPTHLTEGFIEGVPHHRVFQAIFIQGFGNGSAFDAHHPLTGGVGSVAFDFPNGVALFVSVGRFTGLGGGSDLQTTTHTTIGTKCLGRLCHSPYLLEVRSRLSYD